MGLLKSLADKLQAKKDELQKEAAKRAATKAAELALERGKKAARAAAETAGRTIETALFGARDEESPKSGRDSVAGDAAERFAAKVREEKAREAREAEKAREAREVDDELAAMKKRLGK